MQTIKTANTGRYTKLHLQHDGTNYIMQKEFKGLGMVHEPIIIDTSRFNTVEYALDQFNNEVRRLKAWFAR